LQGYMNSSQKELLDKIDAKGDYSEEIQQGLHAAIKDFKAPFVGSNQKSEGQNVRMSTLMFVRWDLILVKKYTRLLSRKHERR
jgi:hypothetical protein